MNSRTILKSSAYNTEAVVKVFDVFAQHVSTQFFEAMSDEMLDACAENLRLLFLKVEGVKNKRCPSCFQ